MRWRREGYNGFLTRLLAEYQGTILLVSHDRYLIDALCTQIWEILPGKADFARRVRLGWMRQETREQKGRFRKIVAEQDALASRRDKWIADFLDRIQTRGFNVHADVLRKIPKEKIPKKPKRKFKVVF